MLPVEPLGMHCRVGHLMGKRCKKRLSALESAHLRHVDAILGRHIIGGGLVGLDDVDAGRNQTSPDLVRVGQGVGVDIAGGELRRALFARLIAQDARLILLDEPFAGVDPIAVLEIQRIIGFLRARGIGVLITDHNVRETLGICDRAYILNEGSVLAQGAPEAILANADVRRVYLGDTFKL